MSIFFFQSSWTEHFYGYVNSKGQLVFHGIFECIQACTISLEENQIKYKVSLGHAYVE